MLAVKQKLKNTKLILKCQIIRQIEKGMTNKEASEKFGVLKSTMSAWMKNKDKLFEGLEQSSSNAKKILKEKALQFVKSFNYPTFKTSDGWLDKYEKM